MAAKKDSIFKDIDVRKLPQHVTPVGELAFGYITEPSREYDEKGQYFLKLKFPTDDKKTQKLITLIDDEAKKAYDMAKERIENASERKKLKQATPSHAPEEDEEGNETGYTVFNFKRKATRVDKNGKEKVVTLKLFDSVGQPIDPDGLEIWGGSEIAVAFKLVPFYTSGVGAGVSHRIEAIQVVKAVAGGDQRSAEDYGFQKQAGGFVGSEADPDEDEDTEATEDETPDSGEDGDY